MKSYMVRNWAEESACCWCGGPIYLGERLYADDDELHVYCSRACYEQAAQQAQTEKGERKWRTKRITR